ncbi:hypothetical protein MLD38_008149 [Melastoma candidum]|uniref:Uncharacterized protein n=1 Tax=Melastoma candidum TaxID=119954 RepID=A0ACB9RTC3_9MYRT|nr:hypothetical protein MLD38_008149 [Melastoma candidum]
MCMRKMRTASIRVETVREQTTQEEASVLDLPELALECILERLPPTGLFNMAGVCRSLRRGLFIKTYSRRVIFLPIRSCRGISLLSLESSGSRLKYITARMDMLDLCYHAMMRNFATIQRPTPSKPGILLMEGGLQQLKAGNLGQDKAPAVNTPPHDLHITNCLQDLRPGDSIEIQWRRNKGFPYGWWYGVVGHLESCDGNTSFCCCKSSDTVVLEFDQYAQGSRWRYTTIDRKNHREEGNEADGFYGGIRKLRTEKEISIWKQLWPLMSWSKNGS